MKIRESCRAPWEIAYFVAAAISMTVAIAFIAGTHKYIVIPYIVTAIIAFAIGYRFESPKPVFSVTSTETKRDSYIGRLARLLGAFFIASILGMGVLAAIIGFGNFSPPIWWLWEQAGYIMVTVCAACIIGWFVSWCRRCVDWSG